MDHDRQDASTLATRCAFGIMPVAMSLSNAPPTARPSSVMGRVSGVDLAAALDLASDNKDSSAMYLSATEKNRGTNSQAHSAAGTGISQRRGGDQRGRMLLLVVQLTSLAAPVCAPTETAECFADVVE